MKRRSRIRFIIICLVMMVILGQASSVLANLPLAEGKSKGRHLVLFLVPGMSFDDIQPFVDSLSPRLQEHLQLAGMSVRTSGRMNAVHNVLSLSTGHQEIVPIDWKGYQQDELLDPILQISAKDAYQQWSGESPRGSILYPSIFQLQEKWPVKEGHITGPGWLGEVLKSRNIYTFALGNSDSLHEKNRLAASFIVDKQGEAQGIIDKRVLSTAPFFPSGQKTDWRLLSTELQQIWNQYDESFTVIEIGDLARIESQKENLAQPYYEQVKSEWQQEWMKWLEQRMWQVRDHAQQKEISFWVLSPMISEEANREQKHLLPLITWTPGQNYSLLHSETTKLDGLISNLDFLPSILDYFAIEQPLELTGRGIKPANASNQVMLDQNGLQLDNWLQHINYLFSIYGSRREIMTTYILIIIFCIIISTGYWWFSRRRRGIPIVQNVLGTILLSPLYFLWLTPFIQYVPHWVWIVALFFSSFLSSLVLYKLLKDTLYLGMIGLLHTSLIVFDVLRGSPWMKRSFLGYDPLYGARFYGLGNEYAGVLLGSSILMVTGFFVYLSLRGSFSGERGRQNKLLYFILTSTIYAFLLYLIAAPHLGTNAGATLASLVTYMISQYLLFRIRLNWKWILTMLSVVGILLASFIYLHHQQGDTHIGKFVRMVGSGEMAPALEIVQRKWELNMKLIRVSLWGKLFFTSLLVLLFFLFGLKKDQYRMKLDHWFNGFRSIVLGSFLILLANDSGIVAAATTMLFVTFPFVFLRFSDIKEQAEEQVVSESDRNFI